MSGSFAGTCFILHIHHLKFATCDELIHGQNVVNKIHVQALNYEVCTDQNIAY